MRKLLFLIFVLLGTSLLFGLFYRKGQPRFELYKNDSVQDCVSLYHQYAFKNAEGYEQVLYLYNNGLFVSFFNPGSYNSAPDPLFSSGKWYVRTDSIFFLDYSRMFELYEFHYELFPIYSETVHLSEDGKDTLDFTPPIRKISLVSDAKVMENVSYGIIKNFGDRIALNGVAKSAMYYIPYKDAYTFGRYWSERIKDCRRVAPYYPWEMVAADWRRGQFKVVRKEFSRDSVPMIVTLEKDRLQYSVVNPPYYWPGNEFRFYKDEELPDLNAWMDSVRVGESYTFELSRPDYPADSIARFAPLQTVSDSIYAADGEAYGYFFAKLIKD